jgi:hypothetical protein
VPGLEQMESKGTIRLWVFSFFSLKTPTYLCGHGEDRISCRKKLPL